MGLRYGLVLYMAMVMAGWSTANEKLPPTAEDAFPLLLVLPNYKTPQFTTFRATKDTFSEFIVDLRRELASENDSHSIPVMRDPDTIPDSKRYVLVDLINSGNQTVTLALNVTNAYVVAFRVGGDSFFLRDAPESARPNLFHGTNKINLPFNSSYDDLKAAAGISRENQNLSVAELDQFISAVHGARASHSTRARFLLVSIQMVAEAARYKYIEQRVRRSISQNQNFLPDVTMLSFENNWGRFSRLIQESNHGVFSASISLQRPNLPDLVIDCITTSIIMNLALLLFTCKRNKVFDHQQQHFSPYLRSIVSSPDICSEPEPTARIIGRDGKCVDVQGEDYSDGNPVILWSCKSNKDINQFWTLKRDGTIRSNEKCLTASGCSPGSTLMIHDCTTAAHPFTLWEIDDKGNIQYPRFELVLSATSDDDTLTVEKESFVPYQAWLLSNNTKTSMTTIVGYKDLCLQRNGPHTVWMQECDSGKYEQNWAIYPDATIRPKLDIRTCLACEDDTKGSKVVIDNCKTGSSRQRWGSRNDGIFYNHVTGLVMNVRHTDPTLDQINMWTYTGHSNQIWLPGL